MKKRQPKYSGRLHDNEYSTTLGTRDAHFSCPFVMMYKRFLLSEGKWLQLRVLEKRSIEIIFFSKGRISPILELKACQEKKVYFWYFRSPHRPFSCVKFAVCNFLGLLLLSDSHWISYSHLNVSLCKWKKHPFLANADDLLDTCFRLKGMSYREVGR